MADLDLDVHSAAYGGETDKTALFFRAHFPAQERIDSIELTAVEQYMRDSQVQERTRYRFKRRSKHNNLSR